MVEFCRDIDDCLEFIPISLEDIHRFHEMVLLVLDKHPSSSVVFCTGPVERTQFGTIFLLGCHLIFSGLELDDLCLIFARHQSVMSAFDCDGLSIYDFWGAVNRVKLVGWVNFEYIASANGPVTPWIDMEEYIHYSR